MSDGAGQLVDCRPHRANRRGRDKIAPPAVTSHPSHRVAAASPGRGAPSVRTAEGPSSARSPGPCPRVLAGTWVCRTTTASRPTATACMSTPATGAESATPGPGCAVPTTAARTPVSGRTSTGRFSTRSGSTRTSPAGIVRSSCRSWCGERCLPAHERSGRHWTSKEPLTSAVLLSRSAAPRRLRSRPDRPSRHLARQRSRFSGDSEGESRQSLPARATDCCWCSQHPSAHGLHQTGNPQIPRAAS
jgi:hypothetical protein